MKKPFHFALGASVYIMFVVLLIHGMAFFLKDREDAILIPIAMLSLFVLSAAIMGFLFLSEPLQLLIHDKKQEAIVFFFKIVGIFACFSAIIAALIFVIVR